MLIQRAISALIALAIVALSNPIGLASEPTVCAAAMRTIEIEEAVRAVYESKMLLKRFEIQPTFYFGEQNKVILIQMDSAKYSLDDFDLLVKKLEKSADLKSERLIFEDLTKKVETEEHHLAQRKRSRIAMVPIALWSLSMVVNGLGGLNLINSPFYFDHWLPVANFFGNFLSFGAATLLSLGWAYDASMTPYPYYPRDHPRAPDIIRQGTEEFLTRTLLEKIALTISPTILVKYGTEAIPEFSRYLRTSVEDFVIQSRVQLESHLEQLVTLRIPVGVRLVPSDNFTSTYHQIKLSRVKADDQDVVRRIQDFLGLRFTAQAIQDFTRQQELSLIYEGYSFGDDKPDFYLQFHRGQDDTYSSLSVMLNDRANFDEKNVVERALKTLSLPPSIIAELLSQLRSIENRSAHMQEQAQSKQKELMKLLLEVL